MANSSVEQGGTTQQLGEEWKVEVEEEEEESCLTPHTQRVLIRFPEAAGVDAGAT